MQVQQACFGSYKMNDVGAGGTAVSTTVTTAGTPVLVGDATAVVSDQAENVTVGTGATPKLTALVGGTYKARASANVRGVDAKYVELSLAKNGTEVSASVSRTKMPATAIDAPLVAECFVELSAGDYVQALVDTETDGDAVATRKLLVSIELVKERK
jgi:hypothetical protein